MNELKPFLCSYLAKVYIHILILTYLTIIDIIIGLDFK